MKPLALLPLLLFLVTPQQPQSNDGSSITVLSFKWAPTRRTLEKSANDESTPPARAVIPQNKTFARNVRINEPQGVRDPNGDTIDGRSAAIDKSVQEARSPKSKQIDGYSYRIKVENSGPKVVEILFWEFQSIDPASSSSLTRRQFLCGVNIRPGKDSSLEGFSISSPSNVVNVETLAKKNENPLQERIVINRVEYADGTIWQRKDWHLNEVKASYQRALSEPWLLGMCKSL
jgi:hypothetical protein